MNKNLYDLRIDVKDAYIKALAIIALSDEVLTDDEKEFIEQKALLLDVNISGLWEKKYTLNDLEMFCDLPKEIRISLISDSITLAWIDGDFDPRERQDIYAIAKKMKIEESIVDEIENWLLDYKKIMEKAKELFIYT